MAIPPISGSNRAWSPGPTGATPDPRALQVARAGGPNAPPSATERRNVAAVLVKLAREQGTLNAPRVTEGDILRLVRMDRALQQAKDANLKKRGPQWTGDLGTAGPRAVNTLMNAQAYGLKADLVRAHTRFERAEAGYRRFEPHLFANRALLTTGIALNADDAAALQAVNEYRAAAQNLERARGQIETMILQLSDAP